MHKVSHSCYMEVLSGVRMWPLEGLNFLVLSYMAFTWFLLSSYSLNAYWSSWTTNSVWRTFILDYCSFILVLDMLQIFVTGKADLFQILTFYIRKFDNAETCCETPVSLLIYSFPNRSMLIWVLTDTQSVNRLPQ